MRIERQNHSGPVNLVSTLHQRGQHTLMASMHTVEVADGHPGIAVLIRLLKAALDVHLCGSPKVQIPRSKECPNSKFQNLIGRFSGLSPGKTCPFGHWSLGLGHSL